MKIKFNYPLKGASVERRELIALKKEMFFSCNDIGILLNKTGMHGQHLLSGKYEMSDDCKERVDFYRRLTEGGAESLYGMSRQNISATISTIETLEIKERIVLTLRARFHSRRNHLYKKYPDLLIRQ